MRPRFHVIGGGRLRPAPAADHVAERGRQRPCGCWPGVGYCAVAAAINWANQAAARHGIDAHRRGDAAAEREAIADLSRGRRLLRDHFRGMEDWA